MAFPADQYAALPWRIVDDSPEYLIVTSRRTARWIFPKGSAEENETPAETALREAAEEAGVSGRAAEAPLGRYLALKVASKEMLPLLVELWPIRIDALSESYPEQELRERRLVGIDEAARLIAQEDMVALLQRFHASLVA